MSMEECADTIRLLASPCDTIPSSTKPFVLRGVIRTIKDAVNMAPSPGPRTDELRCCANALEDAQSSLVRGSVVHRIVLQEVANTISSD